MRALFLAFALTSSVLAAPPVAPGKRILFLGDSITHGGTYVALIEAAMISAAPMQRYDIISAGLSSETVSGLSEPGHADGKFPRPTVHERLDRALEKARPDLVLACYGMNDGIYMPVSEERMKAFRDGMTRLHDKVIATGAKIIHITPPVFDPLPIAKQCDESGEPGKKFVRYDEALSAMASWLVQQRAHGWQVIDLHTTMQAVITQQRGKAPTFTLSRDGVHPGDDGHALMAQCVLDSWGYEQKAADLLGTPLAAAIKAKMTVLGDAWRSHIGHQRPGVKAGLSLAEATAKAAEWDQEALHPSPPKPKAPAKAKK